MSSKSNPTKPGMQAELRLKGQKLFKLDDTGGYLSCLGGLPVAAKILEKSGFFELVESRLAEWRKEDLVEFKKGELLLQRWLLVASGLPDAIDCSNYKDDPALKAATGKEPGGPSLASQSTHTRMEQEIAENTTELLESAFLEFFFQQHKHAPQRLGVCFDGSAIRTHGTQQGSIFRGGKYKQEQFFPLIATTDDGWLLQSKLRFGNVSDANAYQDILSIVLAIKERWKRTKLTVRLDAGFNDPDLLAALEEAGIHYQCGYPFTRAVRTASRHQLHYDVAHEVEEEFRSRFGEPQFLGAKGKEAFQKEHTRIRGLPKTERILAESKLRNRRVRRVVEIWHRGAGWDKDRRLIIRFDFDDSGLDVRCVVTDVQYGVPQLIYENGYCARSRVECWIKENKCYCRVPLSCQEFTANQFRFVLQGLAYQLLHLMRLLIPGGTSCSVATVRESLLLIPVCIEATPRRLYWRLSTVHPNSKQLINMAKRLERSA